MASLADHTDTDRGFEWIVIEKSKKQYRGSNWLWSLHHSNADKLWSLFLMVFIQLCFWCILGPLVHPEYLGNHGTISLYGSVWDPRWLKGSGCPWDIGSFSEGCYWEGLLDIYKCISSPFSRSKQPIKMRSVGLKTRPSYRNTQYIQLVYGSNLFGMKWIFDANETIRIWQKLPFSPSQ